jgi:hypothetical protein
MHKANNNVQRVGFSEKGDDKTQREGKQKIHCETDQYWKQVAFGSSTQHNTEQTHSGRDTVGFNLMFLLRLSDLNSIYSQFRAMKHTLINH